VTKSHDYDPSWDYDLDEKPPEEIVESARVWKEVHQKGWKPTQREALFPLLGFDDVEIAFVKLPRHDLFKYVNGTSSEPVIVLDARKSLKFAHKHGADPHELVGKVLLDGYARAFLDKEGIYEIVSYRSNEEDEAADAFINTYLDDGTEEAVEELKKHAERLRSLPGPKKRWGLNP